VSITALFCTTVLPAFRAQHKGASQELSGYVLRKAADLVGRHSLQLSEQAVVTIRFDDSFSTSEVGMRTSDRVLPTWFFSAAK
jgi:hypothetical protein